MLWVTVLLVTTALAAGEEICLSGDEEAYNQFATKTSYYFTNVGRKSYEKFHNVVGCVPKAMWLLNRHGSHNPEAQEIEPLRKLQDLKNIIINNYRNGNFRNSLQRICPADVNLLERWNWDSRQNASFAGDLTSDGYITTSQISQALKHMFPDLLNDNRHDYLFKYENDKRSSTTSRAFIEGIFRAQGADYDVPKQTDEKLLKPYKFCPTWTREVEENNNTYTQLRIFESKQEYKEMITNISQRLGFNYDIDVATVKNMYLMCRYNKAWDVAQISPWCAVFSKDDLKRLEYAEDLETYYKYGYGTEINKNLGCHFVKDMMEFFNHQIDKDEIPQQPRVIVHFTDAPTMLLALTALGAYRGVTPITGDNYRTQVHQRKWTTSYMSPFNANLGAVLYKCDPKSNFQVKEKFQVLFMENESPLNLEGCRVGLCDWSLIRQKYDNVVRNCDSNFCNGSTKITGYLAISLTLFGYVISYLTF